MTEERDMHPRQPGVTAPVEPAHAAPKPAHAAPGSFEPEPPHPEPVAFDSDYEPTDPASYEVEAPVAFAPDYEPAEAPARDAEAVVTFGQDYEPADAPSPTHEAAEAPVREQASTHAAAEGPSEAAHATGEPVIDAIPDPTAPASPEDTAEIDVTAVEAKLNDPGSTQSFAPITDDLIDTDSTFDAGTSVSLMWGARSDVGCVRSHNEDSYLVASPLFCVCDGMGGHAAGEVASSIAVETIAKMAPKSADAAALGAAIEAANAAIIEAAVNGVGRPGMGCTATAAYIDGTSLAIAHVGDSRAYLLHEGTLIRVTRDHSYVEELVDAGEITADEARVHPNRSVITRALGSDPGMYADHFTLNIEEGDRLILCSDGLSSMIADEEIERVASQSSTAQICTDNLVDAALAAGGGDNVTVVVVDLTDDGRLREMRRRHRRNALFGLVAVLVCALLACVVSVFSIANSVYLGVKDDAVAIYKGVPATLFGLNLHWLEDETSVQLADLPEDTQNRLREGIPQKSVEDAADTVSNYREQINKQESQRAQNASTITHETDSSAPVTDSVAPSSPAASVASTNTMTEGGEAR